MAGNTLTDARVKALNPRKTSRDIRDTKLECFGVLPTGGKRFLLHCQHRGEHVWKTVVEAPGSAEALFKDFPRSVFGRHAESWKAANLDVNRCYLKKQLLPYFTGRPVAEINRPEVVPVVRTPSEPLQQRPRKCAVFSCP